MTTYHHPVSSGPASPALPRIPVAVLGATGYAGGELLRLLVAHPVFEPAFLGARAGQGREVADLHPHLASAYPGRRFDSMDGGLPDETRLAFLALPPGEAATLAPQLLERVEHVLDLSADFRLRDPEDYPRWYGFTHPAPELLASAVYGLPELAGREGMPGPAAAEAGRGLAGARLVAVPGCYATAAALALAPLVRSGLVQRSGLVVDAASGVSGAGREAKAESLYGSVAEDFRAYGLLRHRHTPEMQQTIGAELLFTPHLAPMSRGILATCYAQVVPGCTTEAVAGELSRAYDASPFVSVLGQPPSTKATAGTNMALLDGMVDERTGWAVVLSALDNLGKGAAGQALQCANLVLGLPEDMGLARVGVAP